MAQSFQQLRYFGEGSVYNNVSATDLKEGNLISIGPLVQLGVRALPGTKFYINGNSAPIIVGHLGIFELDLKEGGTIRTLRFDHASIDRINENVQRGYIIIDMLGKGDE